MILVRHVVLVVLLSTLSISAFQRNKIWKDNISLWQDVTSKSPREPKGHINLGVAYKEDGQLDRAINEYLIAARYSIFLYKKIAYENLAAVYAEKGMLEEALKSYENALEIDPTNGNILYNIGFLYSKLGFPERAIKFYKEAWTVNPNDIGAKQEWERLLNR